MHRTHLLLRTVAFVSIYWLLESTLHYLVFDGVSFELFPADPDELSMRFTIIALLVLFNLYAYRKTMALVDKEKEKQQIFNATVGSAMHIINNLLNQMQYFKMQAERSSDLDRRTLELYDHTMEEGQELLRRLATVEQLEADAIRMSVHPDSLRKR